MMKLCFLVAASIALVLSQDNSQGGGGGGQDTQGWTGTEPQVKGKTCDQMTKDNCIFIDEVIKNCAGTCTNKKNQPDQPQQNNNNPNNNPGPKKKKGCFHGDDTVQTKEHGVIPMSKLAELRNTHVLTRNDDGQLEYSPVRYWLHSQPTINAKFLTLRTQSGHRLSITDDHLIYETDCRGGAGDAIYAKNVRVGRCLYVNENGRLMESAVVEKGQTRMSGIYSPITTTGSIVVNDVLASCYNYYENESLQKFVYEFVIRFQDALANLLPTSLYEAAFNSQNGGIVVAVPRLVLNFLQLSNYFVH